VAEQRKQYRLLKDKRKSSITEQRINLLNELDFVWNAQEEAWQRQINQLKEFHCIYGHCNVPIDSVKYPKLGLWIKEQRRHYTLMKQGKPSHMTIERYQQLSALDFCYDTHESTWKQRLEELQEFKRINGTCAVPCNYSNSKLAVWVHHQRRQYKKMKLGDASHMTSERVEALNQIGFVWSPRKKNCNDDESIGGYSDTDYNDI
jgi:hypothetical protein